MFAIYCTSLLQHELCSLHEKTRNNLNNLIQIKLHQKLKLLYDLLKNKFTLEVIFGQGVKDVVVKNIFGDLTS